jgi:hypothetical protein
MKVWYGAPNNYRTVTKTINNMKIDNVIDMTNQSYNNVFGDHILGRHKHLRIEHPLLNSPVYVAENTPITMNMGDIDILSIPLNVVYFLNTRVNSTYYYLMESQLEQLKKTDLHNVASVYVEAVVEKGNGDRVIEEILNILPQAIVHIYEEDFFEYHGIHRVWQLSQSDPNNITLYFHSKGISHIPVMTEDNCRHPVEMEMFDISIERWRHNITLMHLFPSINKVGHSASEYGWIWHNYWWARGSYLRTCEEPTKTRRRHYYEDWLCRSSKKGLPYSHIERPANPSVYDTNKYDCYGIYSNEDTIHSNIGSSMCPLRHIESHVETTLTGKGVLRITPGIQGRGLFNQLNSIFNCIILAYMTDRDVHTPVLCNDLTSLDNIPLSQIINMDRFSEAIERVCPGTRIVNTDHHWHISEYKDLMYGISLDLNEISQNIREDPLFLDIGCALPVPIYNDMSITLLKSISLIPPYSDVLAYCMDQLGGEYSSIHLRLEDDWIDHLCAIRGGSREENTDITWQSYLSSMMSNIGREECIYIATHLTKSVNRNDNLIEELRKLYPNIVIRIPWREKFNIPIGREIDALIDYIICTSSTKFIGCLSSTFSKAIDVVVKDSDGKSWLV